MADDREPIRFADVAEAEGWYEAHHADTDRAWFVIAKKGSALQTPTLAELLDLALAYGWIDGQRRKLDDQAYCQSYGPRRARSPWSQINRDKVAALTAAGRMRPARCSRIAGSTSWHIRSSPNTLVSNCRRTSSRSSVSTAPDCE